MGWIASRVAGRMCDRTEPVSLSQVSRVGQTVTHGGREWAVRTVAWQTDHPRMVAPNRPPDVAVVVAFDWSERIAWDFRTNAEYDPKTDDPNYTEE